MRMQTADYARQFRRESVILIRVLMRPGRRPTRHYARLLPTRGGKNHFEITGKRSEPIGNKSAIGDSVILTERRFYKAALQRCSGYRVDVK